MHEHEYQAWVKRMFPSLVPSSHQNDSAENFITGPRVGLATQRTQFEHLKSARSSESGFPPQTVGPKLPGFKPQPPLKARRTLPPIRSDLPHDADVSRIHAHFRKSTKAEPDTYKAPFETVKENRAKRLPSRYSEAYHLDKARSNTTASRRARCNDAPNTAKKYQSSARDTLHTVHLDLGNENSIKPVSSRFRGHQLSNAESHVSASSRASYIEVPNTRPNISRPVQPVSLTCKSSTLQPRNATSDSFVQRAKINPRKVLPPIKTSRFS